MKCTLCYKPNIESNNENDDCILKYLDEVKIHYIAFKKELQETKTSLSNVKEINEKLQAKIELLEKQLEKTKTNSDDINLEKENSFQKEIESINEAIIPANNSTTQMEDDEDSFFVPTQTKAPASTNMQKITPTKALLTKDQLPLPQANCSPEAFLPKRLKYKSARRSISNNHNATINTSKWISAERINLRACKDINTNINPKLNESVKSSDNVPPSPVKDRETSPNSRKRKNFLTPPKLRQTKLNFKENTRIEVNRDCDDDIVEASPTSAVHISECVKTIKTGTGRKLNQQKSVLSLTTKTSSLNTIGVKESTTSTPPTNIKAEPQTIKKSSHTNLFPSKSASSDSKKELSDNSSLFVLPSQPDDLILIEDSDFDDVSPSALLEEMTNYTDGISESLQRFKEERSRIKKQRQQLPVESQNKFTLEEDEIIPDEPKQLKQTFDCAECEAYFNYLGKNLSKEEIAKRLSNCKHKKSVQLNVTPDGFWDPIFRTLPADDPRNITLIDTRFMNKRL